MPNVFHIVPVGNDAVFNRIPQTEVTTLGLRFVSHIRVLLSRAQLRNKIQNKRNKMEIKETSNMSCIFTMAAWWRKRPIIDGKMTRGTSSPANPALHTPEPLSITNFATSSSHMMELGSKIKERISWINK